MNVNSHFFGIFFGFDDGWWGGMGFDGSFVEKCLQR
jgi:hypothetical protein